jgi:hypothetical protein
MSLALTNCRHFVHIHGSYIQTTKLQRGAEAMYGNSSVSSAVIHLQTPTEFKRRDLCIDCSTARMRRGLHRHPSLLLRRKLSIVFFVAAVGTRSCYCVPLAQNVRPTTFPTSSVTALAAGAAGTGTAGDGAHTTPGEAPSVQTDLCTHSLTRD